MSRRGPVAEGPAKAGFGNGAAFNITAVVSGELASKALPQARRDEHRQQCRSFVTASAERSASHLSGVASSDRSSFTRHAQRANAVRLSVRVSPMFLRPERSRSGACTRPLNAVFIRRTQVE